MTLARAGRAVLDGRFEEPERLTRQGEWLAERAQDPVPLLVTTIQMIAVLELQGRIEEPERSDWSRQEESAHPWAKVVLAALHSALGQDDEARRHFELSAADGFGGVVRDHSWSFQLTELSIACINLNDLERAARLYEFLLPYAGRNVVDGSGSIQLGSAARYLGLLARTMSRLDDATKHFEGALKMSAKMGARPWLAQTQHNYAKTLLTRDEAGDPEKALALLARALDTAQELGMKALVEKALALKLQAQGIDLSDVQTSIDSVAAVVQSEQPDLRQHAPRRHRHHPVQRHRGPQRHDRTPGRPALAGAAAGAQRHRPRAGGRPRGLRGEVGGGRLHASLPERPLRPPVRYRRPARLRRRQREYAEEPIHVRIGLHTGEAIKEADDVYGKNVILAARIAGQARGGEILVSSLLKELTESAGDIAFGEGREVELKGLSGSHRLFEVGWE